MPKGDVISAWEVATGNSLRGKLFDVYGSQPYPFYSNISKKYVEVKIIGTLSYVDCRVRRGKHENNQYYLILAFSYTGLKYGDYRIDREKTLGSIVTSTVLEKVCNKGKNGSIFPYRSEDYPEFASCKENISLLSDFNFTLQVSNRIFPSEDTHGER
jgi:hypothetical protein